MKNMTLSENRVLKNTKIHQHRDARKFLKINWERERERERERDNQFFGKTHKICIEWEKEWQIYSKIMKIRRAKIKEECY